MKWSERAVHESLFLRNAVNDDVHVSERDI